MDTCTTFDVSPKPIEKVKTKKELLKTVLKGYKGFTEIASQKSESTLLKIIHTSTKKGYKAPFYHGLVGSVFQAYNHHHHLVLRPDDIWMAILTQFSRYVFANSDLLRSRFVNHIDSKELVVTDKGNILKFPCAKMARKLIDVMTPFLVEDIKEWIIPNFSTTTLNDKTAASVVMMATMQKYFTYKMELLCGIPKVTLLGTVEDWTMLRKKIDKLVEYDLPSDEDRSPSPDGDRSHFSKSGVMKKWVDMLIPVIDEFINSIENSPNIQFWGKVCNHIEGASGPSYLSGWITVFSVFSNEGVWLPKSNSSEYPILEMEDVSSGIVQVPVIVDDNGTIYHTKMFAGQFLFDVIDDAKIQPRSDWFMALV